MKRSVNCRRILVKATKHFFPTIFGCQIFRFVAFSCNLGIDSQRAGRVALNSLTMFSVSDLNLCYNAFHGIVPMICITKCLLKMVQFLFKGGHSLLLFQYLWLEFFFKWSSSWQTWRSKKSIRFSSKRYSVWFWVILSKMHSTEAW